MKKDGDRKEGLEGGKLSNKSFRNYTFCGKVFLNDLETLEHRIQI